jgi:hypothetical protein
LQAAGLLGFKRHVDIPGVHMKRRFERTSWLVHTPELTKGFGVFVVLMLMIPAAGFVYVAAKGEFVMIVSTIALLVGLSIIAYIFISFEKRQNRSGWVEYDTIRVSMPPEDLVRLLSDILKRANVPHEVLEEPFGDEYTGGSSFALWIPKEDIGLWLADHGPMKSMPSVRIALGKKTGNNASVIAKYKKIIDRGLKQAGCRLYDPPIP